MSTATVSSLPVMPVMPAMPAVVAVPQSVATASSGGTAFVPILLMGLALNGWLGFQTLQLGLERQQLAAAQAGADARVQAATKVRAAVDALAAATARLAADGNPSARSVIEQLRVRGITVNPAGAAKPP